jgi:eukaryotic-like serine/threonine-protein kinase
MGESSESSGSLGAASSSTFDAEAVARSSGRVGKVLDGRYLLERLLGEGGMGTVYRAHHMAMERAVAVKVLRGSLAADPVAARRFALEAKATTRVDSPNAVKVFDFGITAEGEYFMVMEYLDGRTAQRELDVDGPMAMPRALHVARQALAGLGAAHQVGVIHRDIKPENLLLLRAGDDPDFCKVLDFGVAKLMVQSAAPGTALTRDGMVFGTPEFMSPEQACGQPLDGRSDLYSLAATLYTLLTGKPLFPGRSAMEILSKHVTTAPPRLTEHRGLHHLHALDQVLQRALAKRPDDRPRDAEELARQLAFLVPASSPTSQAASPTLSTPALAPAPASALGATPESPLGVVPPAELSSLPTGAAPLFFPSAGPGTTGDGPDASSALGSALHSSAAPLRPAGEPAIAMPTGFRPAATGYLPRVTPDLVPGTQALVQATLPRRRWPLLLAIAAVALAAGGLALWSRSSPPTSSPARPASIEAKAPQEPVLAQPPAPAPSADPTPSSTDEPAATGELGKPEPSHAPTNSPAIEKASADRRKAREHLAAARTAQRAGQSLRQLAQADLALKLLPRDPEALFLLGDALLTSGDLNRGCKTLARLGNSAKARERAAKSNCP